MLTSKNMTADQAESLEAMRSCLQCHLCNNRFTEPATLMACNHSFCQSCILKYTEDNWNCPVEGCGLSVTLRGGSSEAIKKNPIISAVASSLQNIEQILANGPENWWLGQKDDDGTNNGAAQFDDEEEEVVDFQMIMDQDNKRQRKGSDSDDESSTTKEFDVGKNSRQNTAKGQAGRKTMSLDQTLFTSDQSQSPKLFNSTAPPDFSCSPIAMQSSQPDPDCHDYAQQPASTDQHGNVLNTCARKSSLKSPPSTAPEVQSKKAPLKPISSRKKQRTSISVQSTIQSKKKLSPKSKARVSFQQQPKVMLLNPSWTLKNEHTRCLRKCVNDGFISMLKMSTGDAFESLDEFDSGFDFDTSEGRDAFLAMLASNRTGNTPPAPLSFYAISTEKDENFSFGEAIIVPRSFMYYLAVACGMSIVDIEFISSAANMKKRGTFNHQRYPFPSQPGDDKGTRGKKQTHKDSLVLGATNYTWDAPQKAHTAALERHSLWLQEEGPHAQLDTLIPGTDLLHDYHVLLLGEFDHPNHSKRTVAKKRKQRESEAKGGGYCTVGNISLLLQLCGAKVYDIDSVTTPKHIKRGLTENELTDIKNATSPCQYDSFENGPTLLDALQSIKEIGSARKIIVLVKDKSEAKLGAELLNQLASDASIAEDKILQIPVVSCQWLLDSIGEFDVQEIGKYL